MAPYRKKYFIVVGVKDGPGSHVVIGQRIGV